MRILKWLWSVVKGIRWGWGALFAAYTFVVYLRLLEVMGSTLIGTIALYLALCLVASVMRRKTW